MDLGIDRKIKQIGQGIACAFLAAACIGGIAYEAAKERQKQDTPECVAFRQNMTQAFDEVALLQEKTSAPISHLSAVAARGKDGLECHFEKSYR